MVCTPRAAHTLAWLLLALATGHAIAQTRCKEAADCASGQACTRVPLHVHAANKYCIGPLPTPQPPEPCASIPPGSGNECCNDGNCTAGRRGKCVPYSEGYCGGAPPPPTNVCSYDACDEDHKCPAERMCIPPAFGTPFRYTCAALECASNADCATGRGGVCFPYNVGYCYGGAMTCAYDGDACKGNWDCDQTKGYVCMRNATRGLSCQPRSPPPPVGR